jgi:D-hydroxyproline dehydrogenase subunit beta
MSSPFDLVVVGSGVVGLAHAYVAAQTGRRVAVLDRDEHPNGASLRGYGLVQVTGQQRGATWQRASRSRELWGALARKASLPIDHRGLLCLATSPEGQRLLEAYAATDVADSCELLTPEAALRRVPALSSRDLRAALWSPHEIRLDPRTVLPRLAKWLTESLGVTFMRGKLVRAVVPPRIETTSGLVRAQAAVVCPGDDLLTLFPNRLANYKITRAIHRLMRVTPGTRLRLGSALQTDQALLDLPGMAALPEAQPLRQRMSHSRRDASRAEVRLTIVQSSDRSLVVGETREFAPLPSPFLLESHERLVLEELDRVLPLPGRRIVERWSGVRAAAERPVVIDRPNETVRIVVMTSGLGMSLAMAVAEEVVSDVLGLSRMYV